jgi:hypothetical protein
MSDLNEIIPVENADARKDLLSDQFDEVVETTVDDTPEPVEIEEEEEPVEIVAEEQARTIEPPRSWKPEYKDVWDKIDPKVQGYIDQRESEMSRGYEQLKPRIELANKVEEVVQPYVNTMRELNIDTPTAIKGLLEADDLLRNGSQEEKEYYFARLAENYGINLNSVGTQAQPVDQNMYSLKNEVNSVRHEINSFKEQQKQEREQLEEQRLISEIDQFRGTKKDFDIFREDMAWMLQNNQAADLSEAYDKAKGKYDSYFSSRQAQERASIDKAAKTARSAAVSVKTSTPGVVASKGKDRRSLIAEQLDAVNDRF